MRSAWRIAPAAASSRRARPARIGRPAASADVQPVGAQRVGAQVEDRAAAGVPARAGALGGVTARTACTRPGAPRARGGRRRPRPARRAGSGTGRGRTRRRTSKLTGRRGWPAGTVTNGMPYAPGAAEVGPQRHRGGERVGVVVAARGACEMSVFHALSAGNIGQPPTSGLLPRDAGGRRPGPAPRRGLRRRGGGHAHRRAARAALAAARPHRVAVAHAGGDPAVGPRRSAPGAAAAPCARRRRTHASASRRARGPSTSA